MAREMADVIRDARDREAQEPQQVAPPMRLTTLADLRAKRVPLTISVRGMPIHVECNPDGVTLKAMRSVANVAQRAQQGETEYLGVIAEIGVIADMVSRMIAAWDLCEEDGETVVSLDTARLEELGIGLLQELMVALMGALRVGEATGTQSKPRSSPTRTRAARGTSRR